MSENKKHPVVFLSYARTNEEHIKKMRNFVSTLRKDGIDAKIDEWDLKVGNDLYYFMENSIKREADEQYVEKTGDNTPAVIASTARVSESSKT